MIAKAEREGAKPEELFEMVGEGRSAKACIEGDCEEGSLYCGQIAGHIKSIKSAGDVIVDMMAEADSVMKSLNAMTV